MGGPPLHRLNRRARPVALLSAVATLLVALFVCLGDGPGHDTADRAHVPRTGTGTDESGALAYPSTAYVCPYAPGDCALFPALGPAVLTAPPLDATPYTEGRHPSAGPAHAAGRASRTGARPRAPDLHVLQVLRT
ncbi:hypothetical protein [Streptomyces sp. NBC_01216]|uniref:hypothetical protein n=1 Tax=unclassified Streptomyces TaxID=2593676 RepID=UPI002E126182|nr:hypothetical protein OG393_24120 [Streptomyces sp. NBC_01216]